jgi:hypothetical protein
VKLSKTEAGVPGTVKRVTFLGTHLEYELEAAGAPLLVEIYNPQFFTGFNAGEQVNAVLDAECVRILPED